MDRRVMLQGSKGEKITSFSPFDPADMLSSIAVRFERMAAQYPERTALVSGAESASYQTVNDTANRIAHAMLSAEPDNRCVVLVFGHEIQSIIALMAAHKAGKVCIPLDPAHPEDRVLRILEHSEAGLIVTNDQNLAALRNLLDRADFPDSVKVLSIDDLQHEPSTNPELDISPHDPALIVYTSGSTGEPKGVIRTHLNILDNVRTDTNQMLITAVDHLPLLYSYSMGFARPSIYNALLNGAPLFMFDVRQEGLGQLAEWLVAHKITLLPLGVTLFRHLAEHIDDQTDLSHLRVLMLSTEPVTQRDVRLFRARFPAHCTLVNRLGSSEMGLVASQTIDEPLEGDVNIVPVGYAVDGLELLLLDDNGEEVEVGQSGEIVARGPAMTPGYWRNPQLTQQKIRPAKPGSEDVFFFTGDLGLMRPDGRLDYLGRKDFQVKIRGYRVELAEVEMALLDHPDIKEAAAAVHADASGGQQLVAYYIPRPGSPVNGSDLRRWMGDRLPLYMVPAYFVQQESFKLTVTGKVDRLALPPPETTRPVLGTPYSPPTQALENQLIEIWESLLGVSPVGVDDVFWDLGGHSLLAAEVIVQIEQRLGQTVPMALLSQTPTIRNLAGLLQSQDFNIRLPSLISIRASGSRPPLYCIHPRGGLVGLYYHLARYLDADQPVYGLQAQGLDGLSDPHETLEEMAAHYIQEIKTIQPEGPYVLCGFSLGGLIAYEMACQLEKQGEKTAQLILIDTIMHSKPIYRIWKRLNRWLDSLVNQTKQTIIQLKNGGESELKLQSAESRVLWACRNAEHRYVPQAYPGHIYVYRSSQTKKQNMHPQALWGDLVEQGITIIDLPGDHRSIMEEPTVRLLADKLSLILNQAS